MFTGFQQFISSIQQWMGSAVRITSFSVTGPILVMPKKGFKNSENWQKREQLLTNAWTNVEAKVMIRSVSLHSTRT